MGVFTPITRRDAKQKLMNFYTFKLGQIANDTISDGELESFLNQINYVDGGYQVMSEVWDFEDE